MRASAVTVQHAIARWEHADRGKLLILLWRREWDSNSRASFRFCKLQIARCQGCRKCQRCRRALHRIAPPERLSVRQKQFFHRATWSRLTPVGYAHTIL